MKSRKKSVLSVVSAIILIIALLISAGCGSENNSADSENTSGVIADLSEQSENESTVSDIPEADENVSVSHGVTAAADETTAAVELPQTIPGIVELFNKSANRIKPEAAKVVKNYEKRMVDEDELVVPKALESTAKSMMGTFMKDDTEPIVYATREEIRTEYIVPNQSYVSKLTAADVEKATCTDKGDEYVIYIKLKSETNPTAGKGVGSVCDVIEAAEVAEKASFVEKFTTEYYDCEVKVTVDKATGRVVHANYRTPLVLNIIVNMFGTHDLSVGLTFEKDYTITY